MKEQKYENALWNFQSGLFTLCYNNVKGMYISINERDYRFCKRNEYTDILDYVSSLMYNLVLDDYIKILCIITKLSQKEKYKEYLINRYSKYNGFVEKVENLSLDIDDDIEFYFI